MNDEAARRAAKAVVAQLREEISSGQNYSGPFAQSAGEDFGEFSAETVVSVAIDMLMPEVVVRGGARIRMVRAAKRALSRRYATWYDADRHNGDG